jgi:hypothetical protein
MDQELKPCPMLSDDACVYGPYGINEQTVCKFCGFAKGEVQRVSPLDANTLAWNRSSRRSNAECCSSCSLTFAQSNLLHAIKVGDALLKAELMQCVEGAIRMYEKGTCPSTASMVTADAIVAMLEGWK